MLIILVFLIFCVEFPHSAFAESVVQSIERLIEDSNIPEHELGLKISELSENAHSKAIFQKNHDQRFIPASVTKLVVANTALSQLTLEKSFKTTFATDGVINEGVLNGNLYFIGSGDPGFVSEDLWNLINNLSRSGIKQIKGQIIMVCDIFDDVFIDPHRDQDESKDAYNAPLSGCNFNWNSINIYVRPSTVGLAPKVALDPDNQYFEVLNQAKTIPGKNNNISVSITENDGQKTIKIGGEIGFDLNEILIHKIIENPNLWTAKAIEGFLSQRGIKIEKNPFSKNSPREGVKVLSSIQSSGLFHAVKDMLKFSNNLIAEGLTKQLASGVKGEKPATMATGIEIIQNDIVNSGIDFENLKILNPAGLSRQNAFTPDAMNFILEKIYQNKKYFPEVLASLPIGGVDGTLKNRFKNVKIKNFIRAKTGSLKGVATISGYLFTTEGKTIMFSFFYNGADDEQTHSAKNLFDKILVFLRSKL